ncbi:hypothetical protein GF337_13145, partial [candidate division KSB1 bacterium]|nr:hypothetical protein [candidate division KSB1 bacterium]
MNQLRIHIITLILLITCGIIFPQQLEVIEDFRHLLKDKHSEVVAQVGDIDITAGEFVVNYEFGPAFLKRMQDSKQRYLEVMINEKLLALEGYARGLDDSPQVKRSLREVEGDLITEELYKEDVLSKIDVSEQELAEAVEKSRETLSVQWLFTESMDQILEWKKALDQGISFDSLFFAQLSDSVSLDDRMMEKTRFEIDLDNPSLGRIVDTLKYSEPSLPIKVNDGWYIVNINNVVKDVIITESQRAQQRERAKRKLMQYKSERLADQYVHEMMMQQNATIKRDTFNLLMAHIGKMTLRPEKYEEWELPKLLDENPDENFIEHHGNSALVQYDSGEITLADFINWYQIRSNYFHFDVSSKMNFFGSLQRTIWQMMRDKLLIERAYERGLDRLPSVREQKQWWGEKIVYSAMKLELAKDVNVTEEKLRDYY